MVIGGFFKDNLWIRAPRKTVRCGVQEVEK